VAESDSPPREERRVVTVVFTDLVGFTERSEDLDPAAEEHFDSALAACERIGARATAARTRWWYAEMLRARGRPEDAPRAIELEALARADAAELGLAL
jgi:class 3 adenylate cyclase